MNTLLLITAILLGIPTVVIAVETIAALLSRDGRRGSIEDRESKTEHLGAAAAEHPLTILIPAHDEQHALPYTLASIRPQLRPQDILLVVADNCSDNTAAIARELGSLVIERHDADNRGKGHALAAGIAHIAATQPRTSIVIIIDADMRLAPGSLSALAREAAAHDVPIQAIDLLHPPADASTKAQVSALAFTFKNLVRAQGAHTLGIPCLLRGTGMAFPLHTLLEANLATSHLTEDMHLGIDMAIENHNPRFCPQAAVTGTLPTHSNAAATQRTRWEHGHLQTILQNAPRLLWQSLKQRRLDLALLALDVAVPPLALLAMLLLGQTLLALVAFLFDFASAMSLIISLAEMFMLMVTILTAWAAFARHLLPLANLLAIPLYMLWKIPLYGAFLFKRQQVWVRTQRA